MLHLALLEIETSPSLHNAYGHRILNIFFFYLEFGIFCKFIQEKYFTIKILHEKKRISSKNTPLFLINYLLSN